MQSEGEEPSRNVGEFPNRLIELCWQSMAEAVLVVDQRGVIRAASPGVEELLGYQASELLGHPVELLVPASAQAAHPHHRTRYAASPGPRQMAPNLRTDARRSNGALRPVDIRIAPVPGSAPRLFTASIRDASAARRTEDRLSAQNTLAEALLRGTPFDATLALVAGLARRVVPAERAAVLLPAAEPGELEAIAAEGAGSEEVPGVRLAVESTAAGHAFTAGAPVHLTGEGEPGPGELAVVGDAASALFVPMKATGGVFGVLAVARGASEGPFLPGDLEALEQFGTAAAVSISFDQAQDELSHLDRLVDRERIARDLHDTVIQRLFWVTMKLEPLVHLVREPVGERITAIVQDLDDVIRGIRTTVSGLERPVLDLDVVSQVHRVAAEVGEALGFSPHVHVEDLGAGPIDPAVHDSVVAVLREALANVARHAGATSVEIHLGREGGDLVLVIGDDGAGMDDDVAAGLGLRNITARARGLGGDARIASRQEGGTVIEWRVPRFGSEQG